MTKTPNQLISTGLNPFKAVALYKSYRQHVHPKWYDITCPEPTARQWKAYHTATAATTEKRKRKMQQKLKQRRNQRVLHVVMKRWTRKMIEMKKTKPN